MVKVLCVCGARPNFMKVAPVISALPENTWELVHTGQHYDTTMSDAFFRDLGLPSPTSASESARGPMASRRRES